MSKLPSSASAKAPKVPFRRRKTDLEEAELENRPSKTQVKQAMEDLQALGSKLVELSPGHLKILALPDNLHAAIADYQRFTKHEAKRRQLQYIGKLMRGIDPAPIEAGLNALRGESAAAIARMHRLEDLRERFLADEKVLEEILSIWPDADISYLRQLRRNALKEHSQNKPPKSFRLIFKTLKALDKDEAVAGTEEDESLETDAEE